MVAERAAGASLLPVSGVARELMILLLISCSYCHCLDLGFASEIPLKVHSKTCLTLDILHVTLSCFAFSCSLSVSFLHLNPASGIIVDLT